MLAWTGDHTYGTAGPSYLSEYQQLSITFHSSSFQRLAHDQPQKLSKGTYFLVFHTRSPSSPSSTPPYQSDHNLYYCHPHQLVPPPLTYRISVTSRQDEGKLQHQLLIPPTPLHGLHFARCRYAPCPRRSLYTKWYYSRYSCANWHYSRWSYANWYFPRWSYDCRHPQSQLGTLGYVGHSLLCAESSLKSIH